MVISAAGKIRVVALSMILGCGCNIASKDRRPQSDSQRSSPRAASVQARSDSCESPTDSSSRRTTLSGVRHLPSRGRIIFVSEGAASVGQVAGEIQLRSTPENDAAKATLHYVLRGEVSAPLRRLGDLSIQTADAAQDPPSYLVQAFLDRRNSALTFVVGSATSDSIAATDAGLVLESYGLDGNELTGRWYDGSNVREPLHGYFCIDFRSQ